MLALRKTQLRSPAVLLGSLTMLLLSQNARNATAQTNTFTDLHTLTLPSGYSDLHIDVGTQPIQPSGAVVGRATIGGKFHAMLWNASGTPIDLNPSGYASSQASGIAGSQQVGTGAVTPGGNDHALLWNGNNLAIDLNPVGYQVSAANRTSGTQQVGWGFSSTLGYRPLLWNGTNAAIDLQPPTFDNTCFALCTDGSQQVGFGHGTITGNHNHALLWNGSNIVTDLNPSGFTESYANNTNAGYQVGHGKQIGNVNSHALLWHGSNVAVDLNPIGLVQSFAMDTDGTFQVGYGSTTTAGDPFHALLWKGTNDATDLGALLPANYIRSYAFTLDSSENVFGLAFDTNGDWHAVQWTAVPEPAGWCVTLAAILMAITRRRYYREPNALPKSSNL